MEDWIKSFATIPHKGNHKVSLTKLVSFREGDIHKCNTSVPIDGKITGCQYLGWVQVKNILWDKILLPE